MSDYTPLADLWPHLAPAEGYAQEAREILDLLADCFPEIARPRVLDVGCGTGQLTRLLHDGCAVEGVDLCPDMLAQARQLHANIPWHLADARTMSLPDLYHAVLFVDGIDHLAHPEDVRQAMACLAAHVAPDGLLLVAPTWTTETFAPCESEDTFVLPDGTSLHLRSMVERDGKATYRLTMMLHPEKGPPQTLVQTCGLFSHTFWQHTLSETSLRPFNGHFDWPSHPFAGRKVS